MIVVKISHPSHGCPYILRQLNVTQTIMQNYEFHINDGIQEADYWFVLDELYEKVEKCYCPESHVFLATGEPPYIKLYSKAYTNQFSKVFSCQNNVIKRHNGIKSIPFLPWMAGSKQIDGMALWNNDNCLDYNYFKTDNTILDKIDKIAVVTSNKRFTKGHCQRLDFIEYLQNKIPGKIDLYGNGFIPIEDKYSVMSKYKYMLVLENCSYPSYITEKLMDAFLCNCFPFYYGAPDIYNYFTPNELIKIDILKQEESYKSIKNALLVDTFKTHINDILSAKDKVLDKYNLFSLILNVIEVQNAYEKKSNISKDNIELINMKKDLEWRIKMRLKKYFTIDF